jgi:Flp pilus assembly protein TadD
MTTNCPYRILLLAALGFAAAAGCTNTGFLPWKTTSPATSADGESAASTASREELPPKEAARACMVAGEQMQNSGQVDQAILLYEKARRNDPGLKTIAHHLAVLYDLQGDSTRSLTEYRKAVEAEPKNADVFSDLGYYYFNRDNLGDAERELRKALELDPKHAKALTNLGMVLAAEKRFDESFQTFSQVVGPAAAHSNVGVLLAKQGRNDEARREFHEALALDSTLQQPKAFLAYLDRQQ